MSITVHKGFSVSFPVSVTDGPEPLPDDVTPLTNLGSSVPANVRLVYPDPTAGVANPLRSIRVDALDVSGANISARYTSPLDGTIRNLSTVVNVVLPVNSGSASFETPGPEFRTPTN
jgi:hypothetical protein